jgi:hypothetical protein
MSSGPGVPKPRKEFHPNRQVSRQDWHNAQRSDSPGVQQDWHNAPRSDAPVDPNAAERAAENRRMHPASWDW